MKPDKQRRSLEQAFRALSPEMQAAVLAFYADIVNRWTLDAMAEILSGANVNDVIQALIIRDQDFGLLDSRLAAAYVRGGADVLSLLPKIVSPSGGRLIVRFKGSHPRAQAWIAEKGATLITQLNEAQANTIRGILANPGERSVRDLARDLIGKPRLLTLTDRDAQAVIARRVELIAAGKTPAQVESAVQRYSRQLLKGRAETIAQTETLTALRAGRYEGMRQLSETDDVESVEREWSTSGGPRVRDSHAATDGQRVGLDEPYTMPDGDKVLFPGDTSLGAKSEHTIRCRCTEYFRPKFKV